MLDEMHTLFKHTKLRVCSFPAFECCVKLTSFTLTNVEETSLCLQFKTYGLVT